MLSKSYFDEGENVITSAVSTRKHLIVRDLIIRARPEVLSILLNTSCHRYAAVGVNYLEISVSIEYLLDDRIFDAITRDVFNESDEAQSSAPPPWQMYVDCLEKPAGQVHCFLAAFNRGKSKDFTIENGEWTLREGSKLENITAPLVTNAWFSELIKNESEIEKFLKKQIHPAFWPNSGFADDNVLTKLEALATELTKDKYLEQMYPDLLDTCFLSSLLERVSVGNIVGLDWTGNEPGHPFCVFSHDKYIDFIADCMKKNPSFGLHFTVGENLVSPIGPEPAFINAFYLHLFIVIKSIELCHSKLEDREVAPNIRVTLYPAILRDCYLFDERKIHNCLRRRGIVIEFDSMTLLKDKVLRERVLELFSLKELSVALKSSHFDIWGTTKCSEHNCHHGPAALYCEAISLNIVNNSTHLNNLFDESRAAAFSRATMDIASPSAIIPAEVVSPTTTTSPTEVVTPSATNPPTEIVSPAATIRPISGSATDQTKRTPLFYRLVYRVGVLHISVYSLILFVGLQNIWQVLIGSNENDFSELDILKQNSLLSITAPMGIVFMCAANLKCNVLIDVILLDCLQWMGLWTVVLRKVESLAEMSVMLVLSCELVIMTFLFSSYSDHQGPEYFTKSPRTIAGWLLHGFGSIGGCLAYKVMSTLETKDKLDCMIVSSFRFYYVCLDVCARFDSKENTSFATFIELLILANHWILAMHYGYPKPTVLEPLFIYAVATTLIHFYVLAWETKVRSGKVSYDVWAKFHGFFISIEVLIWNIQLWNDCHGVKHLFGIFIATMVVCILFHATID